MTIEQIKIPQWKLNVWMCLVYILGTLTGCDKNNTSEAVHQDYCISKSGNTLKVKNMDSGWGMGITGKGVYVLFIDSSGNIIRADVDSNYYKTHHN